MKPGIKIICFIVLTGVLLFLSCQKELSCENCSGNNKPPIAIVGSDQIISLPTDSITVDGTASYDPDGTIVSYKWTKISGPASANIIKIDSSKTPVKSLIMGVYKFELTVKDNGGLSAKDTMMVIVNDPAVNQPPIANAGADQTITLPIDSVLLNGNLSFDPDGTIVSYQWAKISGPAAYNISNPTSVQIKVDQVVQGNYQFELMVTDNGGLSGKDTIKVTVNAIIPDPCAIGRPLVNAQLIPVGTLTAGRLGMTVAYAGNKLLFAGGYELHQFNTYGGVAFSRVDIYDMVSQTWYTAELSKERANMGVAVAGTKIFFAGGQDWNDTWLNDQYNRIDIYDASNGSWTIDSLSGPRVSPAGEVIGNKVFFGGGFDAYISTGYANIVDIKDLSTNTWSATTLSEEKAYLSSETMGDKAYFAGGAHGYYFSTISNRVDVYNNTTSSWSIETMLEDKAHFASIGYGEKIYWAGGMTGSPPINSHLSRLVEIKDIATNTSTQACLFQPNSHFGAVLKNNKIVFFTGQGSVKNKFDIYDTVTNSWSIGVLPVDISETAIISVNNTIYVAGGYVNGVLSDKVWKLEF